MYHTAQSNHIPQPRRQRHTSPNILSAGFQNKKPAFYRDGVKTIAGIPYTQEEQNTYKTIAELRQTIITLCRDQYLNYDRAVYLMCDKFYNLDTTVTLPFFNQLLGEFIQIAKAETARLNAIHNH